MSTEKNKAAVRRYFEEVWNKGNLAALDEFAAPNVVPHFLPPGLPANIEGFRQFIKLYRAAFPDVHMTVDEVIAEGDKLVDRWTATGTHKGQLMNFAPTFKKMTITGMHFERFDDKGKLIESYAEFDRVGMMQQLGLLPVPA